ncbi:MULTISPECIES: hypothetical protein, partial [unclassified Oceanobacter]|uniref:hypothetical protein n=1 Tax=unclassified Oceanobacter TaxID=2620260 RepID=UPI00273688FF
MRLLPINTLVKQPLLPAFTGQYCRDRIRLTDPMRWIIGQPWPQQQLRPGLTQQPDQTTSGSHHIAGLFWLNIPDTSRRDKLFTNRGANHEPE